MSHYKSKQARPMGDTREIRNILANTLRLLNEQLQREEAEGKVYPPQNDHLFTQYVIVFVLSMVALFAFAVLCLVYVGGTGGWIGFIAASFAILCIASTFIGMNATKRTGEK